MSLKSKWIHQIYLFRPNDSFENELKNSQIGELESKMESLRILQSSIDDKIEDACVAEDYDLAEKLSEEQFAIKNKMDKLDKIIEQRKTNENMPEITQYEEYSEVPLDTELIAPNQALNEPLSGHLHDSNLAHSETEPAEEAAIGTNSEDNIKESIAHFNENMLDNNNEIKSENDSSKEKDQYDQNDDEEEKEIVLHIQAQLHLQTHTLAYSQVVKEDKTIDLTDSCAKSRHSEEDDEEQTEFVAGSTIQESDETSKSAGKAHYSYEITHNY